MTVKVRPASAADLDALVRLNGAVQALHAGLYPNDFKPTVDPVAARDFFADRLSTIDIAEIDGEAAGYIWYERQARPETLFSPARPRLYVHHLAVAPLDRRRGVASALVRHIEKMALNENLAEIALDAWAANRTALRFFRAQGFVKARAVFQKKLASAREA